MFIRFFSMFIFMLLLNACDSDSNNGSPELPLANASADVSEVYAGEASITLDGSASSSPNGGVTSWAWSFISQPENSVAEIADADTVQANFTPDLPGEYVVLLEVGDGEAISEDSQDARVSITALNPNPVAVAPDNISWILGTVQLDASLSKAPDGADPLLLIYQWSLIEKPEDSTAELDNADLIYPRFTADVVGLYKAELVVQYGERMSESVVTEINIVAANAPPMAKVVALEGPFERGQIITLDGSISEDADNDPLQYRWRFINKPNGSNAELSSTNNTVTSFVLDVKATYSIELCVYDGIARNCNSFSKAVINETDIELPADVENTPPVAVIVADSYGKTTFEAERGANIRVSSDAYDVDGDDLTEQWSFVSYPDGFDPETGADFDAGWYSGFTPSVDGEYVVQLTVSDGQTTATATQTYTAMLGANHMPTGLAATASGNPTVMAGETIILDGEGSSDPDDNQLSYQWTLLDRPDGSEAELQDANTALPSLATDQPGPYLIRLKVTDEHGWSDDYDPGYQPHEVVVMAKGSNHPPISRIYTSSNNREGAMPYDAEQPFAITNETVEHITLGDVRFDLFRLWSESYDPDGDVLSHLWTLVSEPESNQMELGSSICTNDQPYLPIGDETVEEFRERVEAYREWTCRVVGISPTDAGLYVFEYQVYDGSEFAGPYTKTVQVVQREDYPNLLIESLVIHSGDSIYEQTAFPSKTAFSASLRYVSESPLTSFSNNGDRFKLNAINGDYTLVDVATLTDDTSYVPRIMDLTNGQPIIEGYQILQGESIEIGFEVDIPADELPNGDRTLSKALATRMNAANINGSFRIADKDGWTVTFNAGFRR